MAELYEIQKRQINFSAKKWLYQLTVSINIEFIENGNYLLCI